MQDAVEALHLMVQRDPVAAERASRELLERLPRRATAAVRARATWALGRALMETGDLAGSISQLRRASTIARRAGDARTYASAQTTLGAVLAEAGHGGAALATLRRAESMCDPADLGRLFAQRVLVHAHRGELTEAVGAADDALEHLVASGDELGTLRLLVNRSIVWLNAGRPNDAERDLMRARPIAAGLAQDLIGAGIEHNLAVAFGRRGEVPAALDQFEVAWAAYERLGSPARVMAFLEVDRAEVLLHAGLYEEAAAAAGVAASLAATAGLVINAGEAQLLRSRALAEVHSSDAAAAARAAADAFRRADRRPWIDLARAVEWEADNEESSPPRHLRRGRVLARALTVAGWTAEASRLSSIVAASALLGDAPLRDILELAGAARRRRTGPAWLRARWWYVEALRRRRRADRRGMLLAVDAGLRAIDEHRSTFGSLELRVGASRFGVPLAALALDEVAGGDPRTVLRWAERWRSTSLRGGVTSPPRGAGATDLLATLRTRQAAIASLAPEDPGYRANAVALARAEDEVRRLSRAAAEPMTAATQPRDLRELDQSLDDRVLVAYHQHRDRLEAVVVSHRGWRMVDIGPLDSIATECDYLVATAERAMLRDNAAERLIATASYAEQVLLSGIDLGAGPGPAIIVPAGPLHRVPWGLLPSLRTRAVTVTPGVGVWLRLRKNRPPLPLRPLLVAGPTLPGADAEVRALGRELPGATVVKGIDAHVERVLALAANRDVLHIAAHGTFRRDNPMLSALQLADGALTVYDLEQLPRVPGVVVLTACSAGRMNIIGSGEVLGTVALLLDRGVTNVVAPVTVLADLPAVAVVRGLYRRWTAGTQLAAALAEVRRSAFARGRIRDGVVAGVLTCFGR